jgi:hypothetical protein
MRFKTIVAMLLFIAAIGIVVVAAPAAAASDSNSITKQGPGGYVVTITKVPTSMLSTGIQGGVSTMSMSNSISQGQYHWYGENINYYTQSIQTYLYWGNPSNSLRLRIISPEGYVFGPYFDNCDGINNGVIRVTISRSGGIAQGVWSNEIYGYYVSGSQSYYIE